MLQLPHSWSFSAKSYIDVSTLVPSLLFSVGLRAIKVGGLSLKLFLAWLKQSDVVK